MSVNHEGKNYCVFLGTYYIQIMPGERLSRFEVAQRCKESSDAANSRYSARGYTSTEEDMFKALKHWMALQKIEPSDRGKPNEFMVTSIGYMEVVMDKEGHDLAILQDDQFFPDWYAEKAVSSYGA